MPKLWFQRWYAKHTIWALIFVLGLTVVLALYNWMIAILGVLCLSVLLVITFMAERNFQLELEKYLNTLGHRVKLAGDEAVVELPYGILLYSDQQVVEWHNRYVSDMLEQDSVAGSKLGELFPKLDLQLHAPTGSVKDNHNVHELEIGERMIRVQVVSEERLIYFTDISEMTALRTRYEQERMAVGIVVLDNLDESTQGLDDQQRAALLARVTSHLTEWAAGNGILMKRLSSERQFMVMDVQTLQALEQTRFVILDEVREMTMDNKLPVTLSMGFAADVESIVELGQMAQSSLDIALGRGGDQVAVRVGQRLSFYGGKTNAVEKRTRVRARVIAHALRDFIRQSDRVLIMGHRNPDTDSIGAAIGVLNACRMLEVDAYIVLEESNPSIDRLVAMISKDELLWSRFITRHEAIEMAGEDSLVVVVDTHKASMVEEPRLLQTTSRIVLIDHHRRGEEFISNAVLIYLEPYASSTCELVTELLQYIHNRQHLSVLEATVMLAGMTVDTKHFSLRTGSRTFDAASFLRRHGADPALVQKLLKEDFEEYIQKAEVIRHTQMIYDHVAIAVTEPGRKYSQLLIAQVADTLLNMTGVLASFVISERSDGYIGISARSLGQMNVQIIMERLGGGGHLTNAAVQLTCSLEEAETQLKQVLAEIDAEEGLFE
ncbi:DHH family phosphoesterase [Paenibacillus marinisediminis]